MKKPAFGFKFGFKPQSTPSMAAGSKYAVLALQHTEVSTGKEGSQEGHCGKVGAELAEPKC